MPIPLAGAPWFQKRIAHLCYHLIRDTMPQSAPTFPALLDHVRELADLGYNGLLLEAEAMFPYSSAPEVATPYTWTPAQVAQLAALAERLGLEVIPLLQSLGHNYFILTHARYAALRELPGAFQQYCPTNPETRRQFLRMAADLTAAFPAARRFHIGGDECRMLGQCPRCKALAAAEGVSELYCRHVAAIAEELLARGITPMLWSDIFESHPEALERFPSGAQLVYWQYDMAHAKRPPSWDLLLGKGRTVIGASAIRFGGHVNDLVPPYRESLPGITDMHRALRDRGLRECIVTDWMKGAHWELSDWGWFYAASSAHDPAVTPESVAPLYAERRFGLNDGLITGVHSLLSVPLPFFEPMQSYMRNRLHRIDLHAERYHARREFWRRPENLPAAREQIGVACANARRALDILWAAQPRLRRGHRQWQLLEDAARELLTRAEAAEAALLDVADCAENSFAVAAGTEWLRRALPARRARVLELYPESMPASSTAVLARMRYPEVELDHLRQLGAALTGAGPREEIAARHVIPFFYNPGPPFERGVEHGRVFGTLIRRAADRWGEAKNDPCCGALRDAMEKFLLDHFPDLIEEMNGIASGAGLSPDTVVWLNVFNAVLPAARSACSTAILRREGRVALLKTTDVDAAQREMMLLQLTEWGGARVLRCGWAGTVWTEFGLNDAGLAVGCNSLPPPTSQPGAGLAQHLGCTPLLAGCRSVREALDFMRDTPFAGKGENIGLADATGAAAVVERCAERYAVRVMEGDFIAATNHYVSPEFVELNRPGPESAARKARIEEFLAAEPAADPVDVLKRCVALRDGPGRVCRDTPGLCTLAAAVIDVTERRLWVTGRPPCEGGWASFEAGG